MGPGPPYSRFGEGESLGRERGAQPLMEKEGPGGILPSQREVLGWRMKGKVLRFAQVAGGWLCATAD